MSFHKKNRPGTMIDIMCLQDRYRRGRPSLMPSQVLSINGQKVLDELSGWIESQLCTFKGDVFRNRTLFY